MTNLRVSQLSAISVLGNVSANGLRFSQFSSISVAANIAAAGLRVSQLFTIAVTSNNHNYKALGPVTKLSCWTPCGVHIWNHNANGKI